MVAKEAIPALRIGVSACLLGREVRFDGQHKRDAFLVDQLGPFVDFVPVCPEVEVGMSIPRETLRLIRIGKGKEATTNLIAPRSAEDWTSRMTDYARGRVAGLAKENLTGYVLKKDSPSCGMWRVKRYGAAATTAGDRAGEAPQAERDGQGLFAAELQRAFPHLPIEEEGRLCDAKLRENFIERIFAYHRLRMLWATRWTHGSLIAFHTAHKMALLAHDEPGYRRLGRLVATGKSLPRDELRARYEAGFMEALSKVATPARHANVLTHMFGHFSDKLDPAARRETLSVVEDHRRGLTPLIVPLTLIRHHVRVLQVSYLVGQTYLDPHPKELMLRNRV
ncbi:MAG: DUF1722 domain-containing protein [Deltaproteobacteria bacterium]|nr:DUF1722 domain-containing protein [Deltaproteobacteria bacterium]